jgi:hypothetical protein
MARLHEEFLAELFGGRKSAGSGSQWQDQADGRNNRLTAPEFAFAWDGKSTLGKGITVDRAMLAKIREQAGGERPAIGLRFYDTDDLQRVGEDWVAITAADFAELLAAGRLVATAEQSMLDAARISAEARDALAQLTPVPMAVGGTWAPPPPAPGPVPVAPGLQGPYPVGRLPVPPHELWPCLVVDGQHEQDADAGAAMKTGGYWIADDGTVTDRSVSSVRYDTGMGEMRLYVNDVRVLRGQLYVDGVLRLTVGGPQLT